VAISVGLVSVAVGIGIPVFYETQIDNAVKCFSFAQYPFVSFVFHLKKFWILISFSLLQAKRDNTQPCFPCSGSGARKFYHLLFFSSSYFTNAPFAMKHFLCAAFFNQNL